MVIESENLEFKREFTEEIYKEVVAFANTDGGTVYVGIDNEVNVLFGLHDIISHEYVRAFLFSSISSVLCAQRKTAQAPPVIWAITGSYSPREQFLIQVQRQIFKVR